MAETWIYLSPHLDDAIYSAGGLMGRQARTGDRVWVWTLFAGDAPPGPYSPFAHFLFRMWDMEDCGGDGAFACRRDEDERAAELLDAETRHFMFTDAAFRQAEAGGPFLYPADKHLFGRPAQEDAGLGRRLLAALHRELPENARVVSPLAMGGHVDHGIVRAVAQNLAPIPKRRLWFYEDYPYAALGPDAGEKLAANGWTAEVTPLEDRDMADWLAAIAAYPSQLKLNWKTAARMEEAVTGRARAIGGARLWRRKEEAR